MSLFDRFKLYRFRNRLLFSFLLVFIPLILIGGMVANYQVERIIETGIEKELQDSADSLVTLIETSAAISIQNRLNGIAEKNLDIAEFYYKKFEDGSMDRSEMIARITEIFLSQPIGISGYIYCLDSRGIVTVHPNENVLNSDVSGFGFVKAQIKMKNGYLEYDWKNPGETTKRPKALSMVYFEPLDWIISVSSYREEFDHLVNIDDFRDTILSFKSGKTGYAYVMDAEGTALVHPSLQDANLLRQADEPIPFLEEMLNQKNGSIRYFWQNPDEHRAREKIVYYRYLPAYRWTIACSSYVEEIFAPLKKFRYMLIAILAMTILSSVCITYLISRSVTRPLESLMEKFESGAKGDFTVRMEYGAPDEFGSLSRHFNSFMDQLEKDKKQIEDEIRKNYDTQAALVENDLKLRGLFNYSFQFTGILSPSGILEEANQSSLDFVGCSAGDVVYRPFWETPWWSHDEEARNQIKEAVMAAAKGRFIRYETTNIAENGEIRNIDISIKPVKSPMGDIAFLIAEGRDITELKQAEQERKNLAVQLEKAQKMEAIGTLAGGIAHDFNNILSGILGYAQLAEINLKNPPKAKGHIKQIAKGAQRAAELTQQILTFSRQTEYEKHPLKLYLVIKEALKLMRSSIPTTIEIAEIISSKATVLADPTQMHQVIMNLCTNAYHAMVETGGTMTVKLTEQDIVKNTDNLGNEMKPGKYLELEIVDTGHGMDKETLAKAFDPYFTTKDVGKGTGFGLALVQAIIEEHSGYIKAISSPGKGSSFFIYLPVVDREANGHIIKKDKKDIRGGTEQIMVVDDEQDICLIVEAFLCDCGYRVFTFENGVKAFETFEENPDRFDLIITDMTMPGMTGIDLARKAMAIRKELPVILCTGYSESINESRALELGIRHYLQKPVDNRQLAVVVREILDLKQDDSKP